MKGFWLAVKNCELFENVARPDVYGCGNEDALL